MHQCILLFGLSLIFQFNQSFDVTNLICLLFARSPLLSHYIPDCINYLDHLYHWNLHCKVSVANTFNAQTIFGQLMQLHANNFCVQYQQLIVRLFNHVYEQLPHT